MNSNTLTPEDPAANGGGRHHGKQCGFLKKSKKSRDKRKNLGAKVRKAFGSSGSGAAANGNSSEMGISSSIVSTEDFSTLGDGDDGEDYLDLEACITVLERVDIAGLTPEQRRAILCLRRAAGTERPDPFGGSSRLPHGQATRRNAKFCPFSKSARLRARRSPLMTKELVRCFQEVEADQDDDDQRNNVTAVLANYGGQIFDGVFEVAPPSESKKELKRRAERRISDGLSERRTDLRGYRITEMRVGRLESDLTIEEDAELANGRRGSQRRPAEVNIAPLDHTDSILSGLGSLLEQDVKQGAEIKVYCPPEWNALTIGTRVELTKLLSWENLGRWDFDICDVAELTGKTMQRCATEPGVSPSVVRRCSSEGGRKECPLLLVGWAVLCAPHAQRAMMGSLGDGESGSAAHVTGGCDDEGAYHFVTDLDVDPEAICNFLREVERGYRTEAETPYHNNIHAADVTQTLHCLLQFMGNDKTDRIYSSIELFSVLLAATFHDIRHPGTNNLFQKNARTDLAIQYNDASILENMHSAVGHSLLMGKDKQDEWDIFCKWSPAQVGRARTVMMSSILGTDMSKHFSAVGELASLIEKVQEVHAEHASAEEARSNEKEAAAEDGGSGDGKEEKAGATNGGDENEPRQILSILSMILGVRQGSEGEPNPQEGKARELADLVLKFLLHAADISNPSKKRKLLVYWADRALDEFWAQGDRELAKGLPISPLCDRRTVKRADSQLGFLKFVIRPTYVLLGDILPQVKKKVIPNIEANIDYWNQEKKRTNMYAARVTGSRRLMEGVEEEEAANNTPVAVDNEDETRKQPGTRGR